MPAGAPRAAVREPGGLSSVFPALPPPDETCLAACVCGGGGQVAAGVNVRGLWGGG